MTPVTPRQTSATSSLIWTPAKALAEYSTAVITHTDVYTNRQPHFCYRATTASPNFPPAISMNEAHPEGSDATLKPSAISKATAE